MKKSIKYFILAAILIGMIFTHGNLFELINIVIVLPIANVLYIIYNLIGDFGLAILIFTILVKLLMWPLTKSQLHQTKLMKKIQPELAEIRKRCNGNKQMESLQTMDLYKKHNVKPFSSILTLLIQLPIFIALYSAIRVMVMPTPTDNLSNRAYSFVQYEGSKISEVLSSQEKYFNEKNEYDELQANEEKTEEEKKAVSAPEYDFHPKFLGFIPLDGKASAILNLNSADELSISTIFALICAISASIVQYFTTKQQQPSSPDKKKKKFRDIMKEAENGKEVDQTDISSMTAGSMTKMMPIMMFFIMFSLPGALVFYYLLSSLISFAQQKFIFKKTRQEMDDMTDKAILKELKNAKEAKIIENKKTGTKITRISAKDNKKKRR
ncbi:YidC/Oxa1 family membrane protein insertase [Candidatus Saccharibacteria bacterium]|nr:YidC/Oxa1 family membrane protein insertase [Candidatus Saccharibacteria bacterium]